MDLRRVSIDVVPLIELHYIAAEITLPLPAIPTVERMHVLVYQNHDSQPTRRSIDTAATCDAGEIGVKNSWPVSL